MSVQVLLMMAADVVSVSKLEAVIHSGYPFFCWNIKYKVLGHRLSIFFV